MTEPLEIEPTGAADFGPCECCGSATRRVWGFAHAPEGTLAAYFVQWAVGRVADHGALFDLIVGPWGEAANAADRVLVTLDYHITDTGPAFMVIDSAGRPCDDRDAVGRALPRAEVIGQPIARNAFRIVDAVPAHDGRVAELTGAKRRSRWRFWERG